MPFVNIKSVKKIDAVKREAIHQQICELMPTLPGKNADNTLLCIEDEKIMFMHKKPVDGVFVEVRMYKDSPEEAKKLFASKLQEILVRNLELGSDSCVYLNYLAFDNWAANGNYF